MTEMRWTEAMSVGVPELDDDHKGLIALINRLANLSEPDTRRDAVRQGLVELMRYAEFHFGREQKVMAACLYPSIAHHIEEHGEFVEKIQAIARQFEVDPDQAAAKVTDELREFLRDWLNHHILIEDKAYRPDVEKRLEKARRAAQSFRATEIWWSR